MTTIERKVEDALRELRDRDFLNVTTGTRAVMDILKGMTIWELFEFFRPYDEN